jgi:methyl-accepting chemotaxis protein
MQRISNIPVSYKIGSLGAVGILGLLLVGVIYFIGSETQSRYQKVSVAASAAETTTKDLLVELLQSRRHEKDFLLHKDDKYVQTHAETNKAVTDAFDLLERRLRAMDQARLVNDLKVLHSGFDAYSKNFLAMVDLRHQLGLTQEMGIEGTLRTSVHAIEGSLKAFQDARLNELMLMMRRHEKDYMLRHDVKYRDQHKESVSIFAGALAASVLPGSAKADIMEKLSNYQREFLDYVDTAQSLLTQQHETSEAFAKIEPGIGALAQSVAELKAEADGEAEKARSNTEFLFEIASLSTLLFASLYTFFVGRGIIRPLTVLGDLTKLLTALAGGDLTWRIATKYTGEFGALTRDANTAVEKIGSTIGQIKQSISEVANASAEISSSTTDLSQRTEEQAASLEETSASMEEISATVKKNAENAQQASQYAFATREVAERGVTVVGDAVGAMARIEESSRKIGDIIGVIDEIARQTNLLALNAAVEAARAGEAGRGFAVVASEVRSLAQRSSQAAKDIADLITRSSGQVKNGVELVNRAGASLSEIVASIKKVGDVVADIATASTEQATGIEQVNKALSQMDAVTQQNAALVEENAATAKTMESQATVMADRVSVFTVDDMSAGDGSRSAGSPDKSTMRARNLKVIADNPPARSRVPLSKVG